MIEEQTARGHRVQWAKVIDHTRCIGCHACTTACKSENVVPIGVTRTYVKHVDVGVFPQVRRAHQVTRCNQCAHAPCVTACPTAAMFKRADGIVDFDKSICIGCKLCEAVCPALAITIEAEPRLDGSRRTTRYEIDLFKCVYCGLCEEACPVDAIVLTRFQDYHMQNRGENIISKEKLLMIGQRYEKDLAADRALDAEYR